jgi:predicted acyltransferase
MNFNFNSQTTGTRLVSIDAVRGFDMFWIIGGTAIYTGLANGSQNSLLLALLPQFEHVPWVGFHFYDLIMPLFLFIVGAAMPFSFTKRLARGETKNNLYLHVLKRVFVLFFLATITQGNLLKFNWTEFYIFIGTLPAIGVGYLISSIFILNFNLKGQIIATSCLLLLYWALMMFVPVPGYGAGVLTPTQNLATYIDHTVMQGFFPADRDYTEIITSMTYAGTVMLGVFAGLLLQSDKPNGKKILWLLGMGLGTMIAGLLWSLFFPIVKHCWTSSFVLFVGGVSYFIMALFYLVIDVWGYKKWAFPFVVIGMNAIAVYIATEIFDFRIIGNVFVGGLSNRLGGWNDFVQAIAAFSIVWLILYYMFRKKSFIKI